MRAGWRVRRLVDGSALVTSRTWRALVPHDEDGEVRLIAAAIRCAAAGWAANGLLTAAHHSPWWMAGGACLWCTAAWRAGAPADDADAEGQAEAETPPQHDDAEIYAGLVGYLTQLIGDRNGVHLGEALRGLQQQRILTADVTAAEFGRQLQRRGIPVRASLKVAGQVGPGVHRDDLPAAEHPLPAPPSMAAG